MKSFSFQFEVEDLKMVHGGWADPIDEYIIEPTAHYFSNLQGFKFVSGHTHIQSVHHFEHKVYCNPGSVGMPRDNDPRAAYAIYDGSFSLHRVEYNMQPYLI